MRSRRNASAIKTHLIFPVNVTYILPLRHSFRLFYFMAGKELSSETTRNNTLSTLNISINEFLKKIIKLSFAFEW